MPRLPSKERPTEGPLTAMLGKLIWVTMIDADIEALQPSLEPSARSAGGYDGVDSALEFVDGVGLRERLVFQLSTSAAKVCLWSAKDTLNDRYGAQCSRSW